MVPTLENIIGTAAGICTAASLLPQLIKMIKEKKATDISLPMLIILLTGLTLWIWYGIMKKDLPIIFTNAFSLVLNILILIFRAYYKRKARAQL
jgi:MtN3 and saliva related transmembrane protein